MRILLTGASGFIGKVLLPVLAARADVLCAVRRKRESVLPVLRDVEVGDIDGTTDWKAALRGVDVVVHMAARAHMPGEQAADSLAEFRKVNVDGTLNLARQSVAAGIKRFVFISSIGVNGGQSHFPFRETDVPNPEGAYALSKWDAEQGLMALAQASAIEVVVIRPPLVYGPKAPGNFGKLVDTVQRGIPLPFGLVHNRRTLIGVDNLADLIAHCVDHPAAANQIFLAGDAQDISTTELIRHLGAYVGKPARLIPVPVSVMTFCAGMLGRRGVVGKICGNLQVDISKSWKLLGWTPPVSLEDGLKRYFSRVDDFVEKR